MSDIDQQADPYQKFSVLYEQIQRTDLQEPAAVTLATAGRDGRPSVRVVLLKTFDKRGFVIYTNLESRKAKELRENPYAALCFYWEPVLHQVRIEGQVDWVTDAEADEYFASRPRGSQIGAWASRQSSVLVDRDELLKRYHDIMKEYEGREVPRPSFWSGFRLVPERFEFWKRGENRLHERIVYSLAAGQWQSQLLYP